MLGLNAKEFVRSDGGFSVDFNLTGNVFGVHPFSSDKSRRQWKKRVDTHILREGSALSSLELAVFKSTVSIQGLLPFPNSEELSSSWKLGWTGLTACVLSVCVLSSGASSPRPSSVSCGVRSASYPSAAVRWSVCLSRESKVPSHVYSRSTCAKLTRALTTEAWRCAAS